MCLEAIRNTLNHSQDQSNKKEIAWHSFSQRMTLHWPLLYQLSDGKSSVKCSNSSRVQLHTLERRVHFKFRLPGDGHELKCSFAIKQQYNKGRGTKQAERFEHYTSRS